MSGNGEGTKKLKKWLLWMGVISATLSVGFMSRPLVEYVFTIDTRKEVSTVKDSVMALARTHDRDIQELDGRINQAISDNNTELVELMVTAMRKDRNR